MAAGLFDLTCHYNDFIDPLLRILLIYCQLNVTSIWPVVYLSAGPDTVLRAILSMFSLFGMF